MKELNADEPHDVWYKMKKSDHYPILRHMLADAEKVDYDDVHVKTQVRKGIPTTIRVGGARQFIRLANRNERVQ